MSVLFKNCSILKAHHEAFPNLMYFNNYAFHNQNKKETLSKMIDSSRMELILDAYINDKIFVESNQSLTFYANQLNDLFPNSRFVHIVRHPGDFVRSARMKGWHANDSIWESGRIKMENLNEWQLLTQIEKLAWVWKETNQFIEKFKMTIPASKIQTYKVEDLFQKTESVKSLLQFMKADVLTDQQISSIQKTKINDLFIGNNEPGNMRKVSNYPKYNEWSETDKDLLKKYCLPYANLYYTSI